MRTALPQFRLRQACDFGLSAAAVVVVVWFYHWTVSTSGGFGSPGKGDYYNFLVEGWRQGHLYISKEPAAEMLQLADPYDPAQNGAWRLGDASYYRGHYYLYFGAAPAFLLMLPYDILTGREMPVGTAIYAYCVLGFLASAALWLAIRRRYFQQSAVWSGAVGLLVLGFGTHVLALARRPLVWELPIAGGYAFAMLALLAIYASLHGKRPVFAMVLAGLSLGLAVASRPTCLFGAAMFAVPVRWWWLTRREDGTWWKGALGVSLAFGACMVAIGAHNYARFGNAFEFGQKYQVSLFYVSRLHLFSPAYFAHNAYIYLFSPVHFVAEFPFLSTADVGGGPHGYLGTEAMCGLGGTMPFLWFALALPLATRGRSLEDQRQISAMLAALVIFLVAVIAVLFEFGGATQRYLADMTPTLALLAGCGWLGCERLAQEGSWHKVIAPVAIMMALATVVMGVLLSFHYHGNVLRTLQPQWWASAEKVFRPK